MEFEKRPTAGEYLFVDDFRLRRCLLPLIAQDGIYEIELLKKRPEIDEMEVKVKDGRHLKAGEVAEHNWEIMGQNTAREWELLLKKLDQCLPRIFLLSAYGGQEAEGIAAWCRGIGQKPEITIIDLMKIDFFNFDFQKTLREKEFDLIIFRDPGPIGNSEYRKKWQEIFALAVTAKPSTIVLTSNDAEIRDAIPTFPPAVREVAVFCDWLRKDYLPVKTITDNSLAIPAYIYGIGDEEGKYTRVVDRVRIFFESLPNQRLSS
jgi:hypothetical protein